MTSLPHVRRVRAALAITAVGALALPAAAGAAPATVAVQNDAFNASTVNINAGESVTWNFLEASHNVKGTGWSGNDSFGKGTFSRKFPAAGTFSYVCEAHSSMKGTVVVAPAAAGPATPGGTGAAPGTTPGTPGFIPGAQDLIAPAITGLRARVPRKRTRPVLSLRLSEAATVVVSVRSMRRGNAAAAPKFARRKAKAGANRFALPVSVRRAGRYRVSVAAVDAAGNESRIQSATMRVSR
jgi:plastocyanin